MAEPLTPEEERYLRETHEWCVSDGMNHEAHRWIATLDAGRALHPVSDATPGLAAARERLAAKVPGVEPYRDVPGYGPCWCEGWERGYHEGWHHSEVCKRNRDDAEAIAEFRAALAASGDAPRDGLRDHLFAAVDDVRDKLAAKGQPANPGWARMVKDNIETVLASESHPTKEPTDG